MLTRGSGKIINIASMLAFQGGTRVPAYAAAKGGVAQLTKALANEWAPRGVNVNAIAPGYMRTDNTQALRDDTVALRRHHGTNPCRSLGRARGSRGRRRLPGLARLRLRPRIRPRGGRRMARAMTASEQAVTAAIEDRRRRRRHPHAGSRSRCVPSIDALADGGVRAIEVTMTVPGAIDLIDGLVVHCCLAISCSAPGTVLDSQTATRVIDAGASFVVSPVFRRRRSSTSAIATASPSCRAASRRPRS